MPDLAPKLHPRVVAGDFAPELDRRVGELTGPHRKALERSHGRFAVLVENAGQLIWEAPSVLSGLGITALPLGRLEADVERYLLAGVPMDIGPGLSPLTDMLRNVVANYCRREFHWFRAGHPAPVRRTLIMGILNTTPDSFSDGGRFSDESAAVDHALRMVDEGADVIDIGGCSTRPDADEPSLEEEIRRTVPVIEKLRTKTAVPLSIDTYRVEVARAALDAGADVINDVTAFSHDEDLALLAASHDVPVVLMHMQGTPRTMQHDPHYDDVIGEIYRFLARAVARAEAAGVRRDRIAVDPGFGFGKTVRHNLELLERLHEFRSLGCPVLVGTSRKSTIGKVLDRPVDERLFGTAATVTLAVARGAAIVRVHDVREMVDVVRMTEAALGRGDGTDDR